MIESFIAVISVVVGFILNEFAGEKLRQRSQRKAVREIIRIEIDRNLDLLKEWWGWILEASSSERDENQKKVASAYCAARQSSPIWRTKALDAYLGDLAAAVPKQQLIETFKFYEQLEVIGRVRSDIVRLLEDLQREWKATIGGQDYMDDELSPSAAMLSKRFSGRAPVAWLQLEGVVANLTKKGNPLG